MNKFSKLNKTLMLLGVTSMMALTPMTALAYSKTETVYTNLKTNGTVSKITVSNHLSSLDSTEVEDETTLTNILNINGKEKFKQTDNQLTWTSKNNKDIYYQGTTEKATPIKVKITYYLDGEKISEKKLEGKSGNVTIKLKFTNTLSNKVTVNGKTTTLYTPFVTTVGTIVKNASSAEITNGKAITTGGRTTMVGIASPGLYDSLGVDEIKDFDEISISYATDSFKLPNIYIVSTPKIIEESDLDVFDRLDTLYTDVQALQDNMDTIEAGANALLEGSKQLDDGAKTLATSLKTVKSAMSQLQSGSTSLSTGLDQILSALKTAESELNAKSADIQKLQTANYTQMTSALETATNLVTNDPTCAYIFNQMVNGYISATGDDITSAQTSEKLLKVYAAFGSKSTTELYSMFGAYTETAGNILKAAGTYYIFYANYNTINTLSTTLSSLVTQLDTALTTATAGAKQVSSGIDQVKAGIDKISAGADSLSTGASKLNSGVQQLTTGISTYNSEGINTLSNYASKAKTYTTKIKKLKSLAENYKGYASSNSDETVFVSVVKK